MNPLREYAKLTKPEQSLLEELARAICHEQLCGDAECVCSEEMVWYDEDGGKELAPTWKQFSGIARAVLEVMKKRVVDITAQYMRDPGTYNFRQAIADLFTLPEPQQT
jgi:hypothetical protein